jgi:hypothetical protein
MSKLWLSNRGGYIQKATATEAGHRGNSTRTKKIQPMNRILILGAELLIAATLTRAQAGQVGHFNGGVMDIRDYLVPEPGLYAILYNYYYTSDRLNDRNGNQVNSVTVTPAAGPPVTLGVDVNLNLYALMPTVIWVTPCTIFGAKYAAYIVPSFANSSLGGSVSTATGLGGNVSSSSFGVGDLFVQPLWLGWTRAYWDLALAYGFYAPIGKYDTETVTLPGGSSVTVGSPGNIGLGFWTQQVQGAGAWYPCTNHATAVTAALTYEYNSQKRDFDLTPGQNLTLNWGISQYLPLTKSQKLLLEVGPAGYDTWEITNDTGSAARNPTVRDQVHAAGGQVSLIYLPWHSVSLNFHGFYEYAAVGRFQGESCGINLAVKF